MPRAFISVPTSGGRPIPTLSVHAERRLLKKPLWGMCNYYDVKVSM